jgi:hypothetical protein
MKPISESFGNAVSRRISPLLSLCIAVCAIMYGWAARAADTPLPEDRKVLLQNVLRRELAKALATFEPRGEESKSEKIAFVTVGYKVEAKAKFPDPEHNLDLKVLSLAARGEKTIVGSLSASTKAEGHLKGTVEPLEATIDFDATAVIERVDFEVVWDVEEGTAKLVYKPKATNLKTAVKDVHIHGDLASVFPKFNELAEKAANSWLEQSKDRFLEEINKSLDQAFRDGKLRISPKELSKPAPASPKGAAK